MSRHRSFFSLRAIPAFVAVSAFVGVVLVGSGGCSSTKIVQQSSSGGSSSGDPQGRRESVPCKGGATTLPIEAFDPNPDEATGKVCDTGNILDDDGSFATIAWPGPGTHKIAGHEVTGCIAAEFSDGVTIKSLSMKMRPVTNGCGQTCVQGGNDGCGTGWKISIFAGPTLAKLDWLQQLSLTQPDFFEYRVVVYDRYAAKFIAICREPTPVTGDSVAIDSIYGFCN